MELGALTYNLNMQNEARDVRLGARGDGDSRSRNERHNSCTVDILYACPTIPFVDVTSAAQMAKKKGKYKLHTQQHQDYCKKDR